MTRVMSIASPTLVRFDRYYAVQQETIGVFCVVELLGDDYEVQLCCKKVVKPRDESPDY